jgi:hypothetical protein
MSSVIKYIKENELDWQPSFNDVLSNGLHGYRGALIVEEGKQISPDRKLPPKIQARQVIMVSDDSEIKLFACELESFNDFAPLFTRYKEYFSKDGENILFVTDLDGNGTFTYEGVEFTAYMLDESSVWNELLELANLEKGDMKKLSLSEKIEKMYDELLDNNTKDDSKSYEDMCALVGESSKQLMGAV